MRWPTAAWTRTPAAAWSRSPCSASPRTAARSGQRIDRAIIRDLALIPEAVSPATMDDLWGTELVEEVLRELERVPES